MGKSITFQRIALEDLEYLRNLRNANREYFFDSDEITVSKQKKWFKKIQNNSFIKFYIIIKNGQKVGTISCQDMGKMWELGNVLIDEPYRKKGIFREVVDILHKVSPKPLFVEVRAENKEAIGVYLKLGFEEIGAVTINDERRLALCKK